MHLPPSPASHRCGGLSAGEASTDYRPGLLLVSTQPAEPHLCGVRAGLSPSCLAGEQEPQPPPQHRSVPVNKSRKDLIKCLARGSLFRGPERDLRQPGKASPVSWEPSLWEVVLFGKKGWEGVAVRT